MSISKDSFIAKAKAIYDRWFFTHDRDGQLLLMEKPYLAVQGRDPWVVDWWPNGTAFDERHLRKLRRMHQVRVLGLQQEVISKLTGRQKMHREARTRRYHSANRGIFAQAKAMFKQDAAKMGVTRTGIRNRMKGVAWDQTQGVLNKVEEYAEKHAAGVVQANHPHIILEQERKIAAGEQRRMVAS